MFGVYHLYISPPLCTWEKHLAQLLGCPEMHFAGSAGGNLSFM